MRRHSFTSPKSLSSLITIISLVSFVAFSPSLSCSADITLYRALYGEFSTLEEAVAFMSSHVRPDASLIQSDSAFFVVGSVVGSYEEALPQGAPLDLVRGDHDFAKQYHKNVFPFDVSEEGAATWGIEVVPTPLEVLRNSIWRSEISLAPGTIYADCVEVVNSVVLREKEPDVTTEELVSKLGSIAPLLMKLVNADSPPEQAASVRFWLGKRFYLEGLALHKTTRASKTAASYYKSAGELFREVSQNYQNTGICEDATYHLAAVAYHLTRQGHPVHQLRKAFDAYTDYLSRFPDGKYGDRARLNLAGILLEFCNLGVNNDEQIVIDTALSLLARENELSEYVRHRITNILLESIVSARMNDLHQMLLACADRLTSLAAATDNELLRQSLLANLGFVQFDQGLYKNAALTLIKIIPRDTDSFLKLSDQEKSLVYHVLKTCLHANARAPVLDESSAMELARLAREWSAYVPTPAQLLQLGEPPQDSGGTG